MLEYIDKYIFKNYKDIIITLFILLVLLLVYIYYFSNKVCNSNKSLNYYIYESNNSNDTGPTILIIGGTHGNEPAGSETIKLLIKELNSNKLRLKRGRLILVPEVNYCGLRLDIRFILGIGDLNRKYPTKLNVKSSSPINNKIIDLASQSDFILDFHEGWGFHKKSKDSIGSTITPNDTIDSNNLAKIFLNEINKNINEPIKKFTILTNREDLLKLDNYSYSESAEIKGSLRYYLNLLNKNYILIETTGQNNIQNINIRINQDRLFINKLLEFYELI